MRRTKLLFLLLMLSSTLYLKAQTVLFEDNFLTYSGSLSATKWYNRNPSSNYNASGNYVWRVYTTVSATSYYLTSVAISLPAASEVTLAYKYKYAATYSQPTILISTTNASSGFVSLKTITGGVSVLTDDQVDLSTYAGQTVYIKFQNNSTYNEFLLDDVKVSYVLSSPDYQWSDDFNDNDLLLDYTGYNGNEAFAGKSWNIQSANLAAASSTSSVVNYKKTESFTASTTAQYNIQLDKTEYFESPSLDISTKESFKINFFVKKSSGTVTDWMGSKLLLKAWNGTTWQTILTLGSSTSDDMNMISSGFGYHCVTVYKSSTSPGNYYNNAIIIPGLFNTGFKFRFELTGYGSIKTEIDQVSFRASQLGTDFIPCGLSYWNSSQATHYGLDPEAGTNPAARGVEVETNDPFNITSPPNFSTHCNDGNTGAGFSGFYTVWAVISEQEISTTYAKIHYDNGTTNFNKSMQQNSTYSGPGFLYYYKEYTGCNGEVGAFDPSNGLNYSFYFDYGSNLPGVYYQLNSTGNEIGGGVTTAAENLSPGIDCNTLPVELWSFTAKPRNECNLIEWISLSEINSDRYRIEKSNNGVDFNFLADIKAAGESQTQLIYQIKDCQNTEHITYYRLSQIDYDGSFYTYPAISIVNESNSKLKNQILVHQNRLMLESENLDNIEISIFDLQGRAVWLGQLKATNEMDMSFLENGVYLLAFFNGYINETQKFTISK